MNTAPLNQYLQEHIPLSAAMQVKVEKANAVETVLTAPLLPNINHRETVFGGSLSALGILCAWTHLHHQLTQAGMQVRLVIQRNSMEYQEPGMGAFRASLLPVSELHWSQFLRMIEKKSKGRITVKVRLTSVDEDCPLGVFEGTFVAIKIANHSDV